MTPKEKAKELIDILSKPIDGLGKYPMCFDTSKQCALLCVDENIKSLSKWIKDSYMARQQIKFLEEVKLEINKL